VLTGAAVAGTGNALVNRITGNAAGNLLSGLDGNDVLAGEEGADTLVGGAGADVLTGGAGADRFLFGAPAEGVDRIADFVAGEDLVVLLASGFAGVAPGALPGGGFVAHASNLATAPEGVAQVIYNTEAGLLFFDADGMGGAAAVRLAVLTGVPALTAADVLIG
jgi:Ca2+-binding RTX toxin-like protein